MGGFLALGAVAAITDNDGRSVWWPPLLATAVTIAFMGYAADAHRTGIAQWKFGKVDRVSTPSMFKVTLIGHIAAALLFGA